jgi:cation diffusion facilitator CzcD-associated flavoprotein CzcO
MDLFMVAPILHGFSRLPANATVALLPLYDKMSRLVYRVLLRATVRDRGYREALLPRYGVLAKRPVISSAFFPALNRDSVSLITTPISRLTRDGVLTVDGAERSADLVVMATGYELYTDPETYRVGTIIGRDGFDLAREYRANGLRCYAGTAHPFLPNRWDLVGPQGFVGLAWTDWVETTALHAARLIAETRRIGADVAEVKEDAFNRWNDKMRKQGKAVHLYTTQCNPGLRTYFVNSHGEALYYRPQTIHGARWHAHHSPLTDYTYSTSLPTTLLAPAGSGMRSAAG